jgi:CheY-like chemotaxis protein
MNTSFFRLGTGRAGRYLRLLLAPATGPQAEARPVANTGKKILVVDDDPIILKTMALKLVARGFAVVTALDGSAAIAAVRDEQPDLVLLDLSFPPDVANGGRVTWDGFQIMSWLRGLEGASRIPFIIITAEEPSTNEQRCRARGAAAFFHKPIQHDDLLRVIQRTLEEPEPVVDKEVA